MVKKLCLYVLMAMIQKFILMNNKLTCGKDLQMYAVPRVSSCFATLERFICRYPTFPRHLCVACGDHGGQGLQQQTQGAGVKDHTLMAGQKALLPAPRTALTVSFNVYFYLSVFRSAGSSLPRGLFTGCGERGLLSSCRARAPYHGGFSYRRAWAQWLQLSGPRAQAPYL